MSQLGEAFLWAAVGGLCLRILGLRWAVWLMLPAALWFVAWPLGRPYIGLLPWWLILLLIPLVPVVGMIMLIRAGQAILTGLFGDDAAAHVVGHWIISLLGGFGRGRRRRVPDPILPRPGAAQFDPREIGGGQ